MKKFVIVRFAPGSAGKFCSILLQLSPQVNAWDPELDQFKYNPTKVLDYFKSKFTRNFRDWQKNEPEIPYQTQFVSNRFSRGDDIGHDQALEHLKNDDYFNSHYQNSKKIILISNKSRVPDWIHQRSDIVNIYIDTIAIKKWVQKARYFKLFLQVAENQFILKQEHPDYCNQHRAPLARQFQNQHTYYGTKCSFLKNIVLKDPYTKLFTNYDNIIKDTTNLTVDQHCVYLSHLLDIDNCYLELKSLCKNLDIECPNQLLIQDLLTYYLSLHQNY